MRVQTMFGDDHILSVKKKLFVLDNRICKKYDK